MTAARSDGSEEVRQRRPYSRCLSHGVSVRTPFMAVGERRAHRDRPGSRRADARPARRRPMRPRAIDGALPPGNWWMFCCSDRARPFVRARSGWGATSPRLRSSPARVDVATSVSRDGPGRPSPLDRPCRTPLGRVRGPAPPCIQRAACRRRPPSRRRTSASHASVLPSIAVGCSSCCPILPRCLPPLSSRVIATSDSDTSALAICSSVAAAGDLCRCGAQTTPREGSARSVAGSE